MAFPTLDSNHQAEALALFTDHYRDKLNITRLMSCFMPSIQELEGVFWDIINKFMLANSPVGDQLNALGNLVGAQRGTLSDAEYLQAVVVQIRVNRSQGLSEDIIQVATLVNGPPNYVDIPVASFLVESWDLLAPYVLAAALSATRSAGTRGVLHFSTWPDGNDFEFDSHQSPSTTGEGVWGSRYTTAVGSLMVAGAGI